LKPSDRIETSERLAGWARTSELIAVVFALEERDRLDVRTRRRLDREIGAASSSAVGLPLLRIWLAIAPSESLRQRLHRVRAALSTLTALLAALGFFLGWAAAAALLSVEVHAGRINIVLSFALLVLLPFFTVLISLAAGLAAALGSGGERPSGARMLLSGSGVARLVLRALSQTLREDLLGVLGRMTAYGRLYGRVERGQFLVWSQTLGLSFASGVLVATLAFIAFTDLAFGWSSTLEIEAGTVHAWVHHIALPWAWLWPAANPPLELVESTRFFRVAADDHVHVVDPILFGGWWPFLVASIGTYTILPRLFVFGGLRVWHAREVGRAIGLTPGVDRLIDRLRTPLIEGQALEEEGEIGARTRDLVPLVDVADWFSREGGSSATLIRWAALEEDAGLRSRIGIDALEIFDAGGRRSLAEDEMAARDAAARGGGVAIGVRGYEPPVLDVLDFLVILRTSLGRDQSIAVLLFDARDRDLETWRRKLTTLGDPRLVVARPSTPASSTHV
jgi:hypothetical protein